MGTTVIRFCERDTATGKPIISPMKESDDSQAFEAFVPHTLADWDMPLALPVWGEALRMWDSLSAMGNPVNELIKSGWMLTHLEGIASSRIEGVEPALYELVKHTIDLSHIVGQPEDNDMEVAQNVLATRYAHVLGKDRNRDLTKADICKMHHILMKGSGSAGELRNVQTWVGEPGSMPSTAVYVPPPLERVDDLVDDLVDFINREDVHPVIKMAVAPLQFELVHPFPDGNGKTGRILMHYIMSKYMAECIPVIPISLSLLTNHQEYVEGLRKSQQVCEPDSRERATTMGDWIRFVCDQINNLIGEDLIISQIEHDLEVLRTAVWEPAIVDAFSGEVFKKHKWFPLLDALMNHPVVNRDILGDLLGMTAQTAAQYLVHLEKAEIVTQIHGNQRYRVFAATEVVGLLHPHTTAGKDQPTPTVPKPSRLAEKLENVGSI